MVARLAHNQEVAGSTPAPATSMGLRLCSQEQSPQQSAPQRMKQPTAQPAGARPNGRAKAGARDSRRDGTIFCAMGWVDASIMRGRPLERERHRRVVAGATPASRTSSFRSACRRAAASPMAERQGDSRTGWTSHRPVASDLAVRRRVAHGIQPKSRAAGERSTASYTACASSARRDSLLPIFPKRPARGARRRGDGRGARILLGRGRVRVRGRVRGRGRGRVTP